MATDTATRQAMKTGREQARVVVEQRAAALKRRTAAVRQRAAERAVAAPPPIKPELTAAIGREPPVGVLVAEGDSWFDYPFVDILSLLEDQYAYDVRNVAHMGDRVEDMAYGGDGDAGGAQLVALTRLIEKLLREGKLPRAILLSGGGNDIAGDEFAMLLEHKRSAIPGLNEQILTSVVDQRLRLSYVTILSAVTRVCELRAGTRIPIVVHGYDYPVPDGRGYLGGWGPLPGPWLDPAFRQKGYADLEERIGIVRKIIHRFNEMLKSLVALPEFAHVSHVDLRDTLTTGPGYKKLWENELHPTRRGFEQVAAKIASAIA